MGANSATNNSSDASTNGSTNDSANTSTHGSASDLTKYSTNVSSNDLTKHSTTDSTSGSINGVKPVNDAPMHYPSDVNSPKSQGLEELELLRARDYADQISQKRRLFVFSHATERGMSAMAKNFKQYLQTGTQDESQLLDNLAHTLAIRRSRLAFRVAVSATNLTELTDILEEVSKGTIRPQKALKDPRICFTFTGEIDIA